MSPHISVNNSLPNHSLTLATKSVMGGWLRRCQIGLRSLTQNASPRKSTNSACVTERCVSSTNLDLATPNFAEQTQTSPRNQPRYHRTVYTTFRSHQQSYPTESQTNNRNNPFVPDYPVRQSRTSHHKRLGPTSVTALPRIRYTATYPTDHTRLDDGRRS